MLICSKETAAERKPQREKTASKRLKQNMQLPDNFFVIVAKCWSERSSRRMPRTLLEDTWRPWIFIIMSLCHFCDYYVIIISHSYVPSMRGQKMKYVCSVWFSFCGRFFGAYWHFVLWKLSAKLLHCFTANETKLRYQGHPTPRMTKTIIMLYFTPCALGAPASDDISVFEKKEDMLFFHFYLR